jgi:hypothetical protein
MFVIVVQTYFIGPLVITFKLKAEENFCMAAILFYLLQEDNIATVKVAYVLNASYSTS